MTPATTSPAETIAPAEAKFWQEQAQKVPQALRANIADAKVIPASTPFRQAGIGIGAALGVMSFTKYVPGKWKWLTGGGAALAAAGGLALGKAQDMSNQLGTNLVNASKGALLAYASDLETKPELSRRLAGHLSASVTGEDIKAVGLDGAVMQQAHKFAAANHYLDPVKLAIHMDSGCSRCI